MKNHSLITSRQEAPSIYNITTVAYAVRPEFVFEANSIFEGQVRMVEIPIERSIDIDTIFDFNIAEYLFKSRENI
jgi:N-acylneuraminate cytidylyltransferase